MLLSLTQTWLFHFDPRGTALPIFTCTGLSENVDELRSDCSSYSIRLPGGSHRHPRVVLGSQIPENHIFGGYSPQRLADHRHAKPRRYECQRASGAVRFLDDLVW
jgi:hypothetical protein